MNLPEQFVLWHSSNPFEAQEWSACLIESTRTSEGYYKLRMLPNPTTIVGNFLCIPYHEDEWFQHRELKIIVERIHVRPNSLAQTKYHESTLRFQTFILKSGIKKVPVLRMTNALNCLGKHFTDLLTPDLLWKRLTVKPNERVPTLEEMLMSPPPILESNVQSQPHLSQTNPAQANQTTIVERSFLQSLIDTFFQTTLASQVKPRQMSTSTVKKSAIPQHIVNGFLDSLFTKNETCPISGEVLQKESTYLTPCGHAISFYAGQRWIPSNSTCPVCRSKCTMDTLETYK